LSDAEAILRWLLVLTMVSFAFAPLVWWLGSGLDAAASGLLRPLGVVLLTTPLWWVAAVLDVPFSRSTLVAVAVVGGSLAWGFWLHAKRAIPWTSMFAFESLWLFLFATYAVFRAYNPHIANTEKPMEIAFLSSISRSDAVPAPDPWWAGEAINYYYFGYQAVASIVKLSGVPAPIAFNLALATLFASTGTAAAAIGYRFAMSAGISRQTSIFVAGLAPLFVLLAGNMETAWRLVRMPRETVEPGWWYDGVGWQASRVIVDHGVHGIPGPRGTINEFPAFSFVLGDLHPHVLTYPLLVSILALCIGMILSPATLTLPRVALTGGLSGLLYVSNSWDAPIGLLMLALSVVLLIGWNFRQMARYLVAAIGSAIAVALPFVLTFTPPVGLDQSELPWVLQSIPLISTLVATLGVVTWKPSGVGEILLVHGHWVAASIAFIGLTIPASLDWTAFRRDRTSAVAISFGLALLLAIVWSPAIVLIGVPLTLTLLVAGRSTDPLVRLTGSLFSIGFLLVLIPEYLYIQDAFGDRMNTVFKLYFQAWLFLALATAATAVLAIRNTKPIQSKLAVFTVVLMAMLTLPYTPISARDWTDSFATRYGLDGGAYIERAAPDDYLAIQWLNDNLEPDSTLVEGPGCSYQSVGGVPMNRISAFTGIPTIVGWEGHQRQWRRGQVDLIGSELTQRQELANQWLDGTAPEPSIALEPEYVVLGHQERVGSSGCDPLIGRDTDASVERLVGAEWVLVYQSGNTSILKRP